MITPRLQKIPGADLTTDQLQVVMFATEPKYGPHDLPWYTAKTWWFVGGRFADCFQ